MTIKCKDRIHGMIYPNDHCLRHCRSRASCMYLYIILKIIVQAYLHSMHNQAVAFNPTPLLQKLEKIKKIPRDWRLPQLNLTFTKFIVTYADLI